MPRGQRRQLSHSSQVEMQETRRTILRTAARLFMEHGYRAVSTRQIADICGLTQPALYHYFSDKQDLYVAVMREELAETKAALERIARRNESIQERLKRVVRYLLSTVQHDLGMMFHDINNELSTEAQRLLTEEHRASMIAPIASIFQAGIQQGVLRTPQQGGLDATGATYLFLSMLSKFIMKPQRPAINDSYETYSVVEGNGGNSGDSADIVVNVLLYGLALPEQSENERRENKTCSE
ncbi:MAG TPA: TetR/AcrR family transcriptional regulator [Ktedonobacter sp.]|nr:TetR/AcrR family transcriptional regulator [Ktedonobacter sp.]